MSKASRIIIGAVIGASAVYGLEVRKANKFKKEVEKVLESHSPIDRIIIWDELQKDIASGFWKQFDGMPTTYVSEKIDLMEAKQHE